MTGEGNAIRFHDFAMDQIMHRLAYEITPGKFRPEKFVTIRHDAIGRSQVIRARIGIIEALGQVAGGKYAGVVIITRQDLFGGPNGKVRIPRQIILRREIVPRWRGVFDAKPVAPIVTMPPILRLPGLRFKSAVIRAKPEIAPADIDRPARLERSNRAPAITVGAMQPVIQPVIESVGAVLLVAFAEPGEQGHVRVRVAVAVRVLRVKYFRRIADDHALAPRNQARGKRQSVKEHSGFVVMPITLRVLQKTDDAAGFTLAIQSQWIIAHFDDPKFSIRTPLERNRAFG